VRSGAIDVLVVDSVAALVPRAELEARWAIRTWPAGPPHDQPAQAHRLDLEVALHGDLINQNRYEIGVMFGIPRPPPGGKP